MTRNQQCPKLTAGPSGPNDAARALEGLKAIARIFADHQAMLDESVQNGDDNAPRRDLRQVLIRPAE